MVSLTGCFDDDLRHWSFWRCPYSDRGSYPASSGGHCDCGALRTGSCRAVCRAEGRARRASTLSNTMLQRERDNKLMNMQALTAAIAHQVRQPLGVIQANSNAALNFLSRAPPDLEEIQAALTDVIGANRRVSEVFDSIRTLFGKVDQGRRPIDLNEVILKALHSMRGELKNHDVETRPELTLGFPACRRPCGAIAGGHHQSGPERARSHGWHERS